MRLGTRCWEQHGKKAEVCIEGWYGNFPKRSDPNIRENLRRGYFDQLQFFVSLGFKRMNYALLVVTSPTGNWNF